MGKNQSRKKRIVTAVVLLLVLTLGVRMLGQFSNPPDNLGAQNGRLATCPDSPNCVSSQANKDDSHYIEPLRLAPSNDPENPADPPAFAIASLAELIRSLPRTTVYEQTDDYLRVEFRSLLFGFFDDVEFLVDRPMDSIHVRSASRWGYSDFGANRRRIEKIRQLWEASLSTDTNK